MSPNRDSAPSGEEAQRRARELALFNRLLTTPRTRSILIDAVIANTTSHVRHRGWRHLFDEPANGHCGCIECPRSAAIDNHPLLDGLSRLPGWPKFRLTHHEVRNVAWLLRSILESGRLAIVFIDAEPVLIPLAWTLPNSGNDDSRRRRARHTSAER